MNISNKSVYIVVYIFIYIKIILFVFCYYLEVKIMYEIINMNFCIFFYYFIFF